MGVYPQCLKYFISVLVCCHNYGGVAPQIQPVIRGNGVLFGIVKMIERWTWKLEPKKSFTARLQELSNYIGKGEFYYIEHDWWYSRWECVDWLLQDINYSMTELPSRGFVPTCLEVYPFEEI